MNGGRNYNGPKVDRCLSQFDYLLEYLADPPVLSQGAADIGSDMTSDNPRGVHRSQSDEPDNQQERPARESTSESSETIRRTSGVLDEEMVRAAWRHAGIHHPVRRCLINMAQRNSLSGKPQLAPERSDPFLLQPAHIGETHQCLRKHSGNAEGSLRDPVTTALTFWSERWRLQPRTEANL